MWSSSDVSAPVGFIALLFINIPRKEHPNEEQDHRDAGQHEPGAAVLVSGTPDASASVVPASGCTGYLTATSAYNGSTLQGKTIVLAIGCTAAQASISYQSNGVQYGNGAYLTGSNVTSTAWAGNNNVVQHIGYIWVGSGLYRYYF